MFFELLIRSKILETKDLIVLRVGGEALGCKLACRLFLFNLEIEAKSGLLHKLIWLEICEA